MQCKTRIMLGLIWAGLMWAEGPMGTRRQGHTLLLPGVFVNGQGPLVMLVDTGAASSTLRPEVAKRVGLEAKYRVEMVTAAGSRLVIASQATMQVGHVVEREVEILLAEVEWAGVDGVLGQSFLSRRDYELDFEKERIEFDGEMPARGVKLPLEMADGRPAIRATVDGERVAMVLDSGASMLLLFRMEKRFGGRARVETHVGAMEAGLGEATVEFAGRLRKRMQAAELPVERGHGLMPVSAFRRVFVANRAGVVVLDGRHGKSSGQ